jgi:flagellar biosynthetic protein FliR/type III secretion protein T
MLRSFRAVPLGAFAPDAAAATAVVTLVGTAVGAGFAVGAPVVGCSLAVDALISLAARAAGGPHLCDLAAPARILLGAAAMWLSLGVVCERLLATQWASFAELGGIQ